MNNFGDWFCIELLLFVGGLLVVYFYNNVKLINKMIPKIFYEMYI